MATSSIRPHHPSRGLLLLRRARRARRCAARSVWSWRPSPGVPEASADKSSRRSRQGVDTNDPAGLLRYHGIPVGELGELGQLGELGELGGSMLAACTDRGLCRSSLAVRPGHRGGALVTPTPTAPYATEGRSREGLGRLGRSCRRGHRTWTARPRIGRRPVSRDEGPHQALTDSCSRLGGAESAGVAGRTDGTWWATDAHALAVDLASLTGSEPATSGHPVGRGDDRVRPSPRPLSPRPGGPKLRVRREPT